ncbi:thiol-disulfide isomerase [Erwinia sp. OLTSP20]|uniref:conjugal transfer protein TraF n=1 Tax=unclassified Erwinia TaxID=2622719 RepID=UPI000C19B2AB|nr:MULTISPECIES: conjugal transfer protein TraF [unclassified Erwinia]PIJ50036.1 thiol-disulfide isomerase [Erwinia sp. OAMSP11]PIJ72418.1 thiol-disulfide isomerase [Erwinia sp. OLSSP12]PIJ80041.1 thiol-disulfide isomerase [Erwinia sp. OLCASP19]PIJ82161.1 thiol-disulfide isomerase [Erwinia sp. OLMTSP26]PIJ86397.1 thiol-disulfide isomerase [Erwinia sp. OLMDSP33]
MLRKILAILLLLVPALATAGTIDEIARLEQGKGTEPTQVSTPSATSVRSEPAGGPVWLHLPDGRRLDIRHWQIVHFVRSDCPYCHRFNPVLKAVAAEIGLNIFVYSFDGAGDAAFPKVAPVNDRVLKDFFAELPRATPTDFIVNTQTLVTIPLSQGEMSGDALKQRLEESFLLADRLGVL